MVDRADGWEGGMPPAVRDGESTYLTCLYILALEAAVRLHREAGDPTDAIRWEPLPERLRQAVRSTAWSEQEGLYLEGPGRTQDRCSQHAQCLAILSDTATPEQSRRMQSYYLARALEKAGGYAAFHDHVLERWRVMLGNRVSTWQEYPDPTRSDCHAWSSWIAVDFVATVLGIRPGSPGWSRIRIAPCSDGLEWARGSAPTPAGRVQVAWRRDADLLHIEGCTPEGVPADFHLPGMAPFSREMGGRFAFARTIPRTATAAR
jgi:hypothetical protein